MASYKSNAAEVKKMLGKKEERALHAAGLIVQKNVILNIDKLGIVDTGRLKGSYGFKVDMKRLAVDNGTNVEYAPYHEFGTGIFAENGTGRTKRWSYQRADGTWVSTKGMAARPHLRPAYTEHVREIRERMQMEMAR